MPKLRRNCKYQGCTKIGKRYDGARDETRAVAEKLQLNPPKTKAVPFELKWLYLNEEIRSW